MSQKLKSYFNWSTGKDASLALYYLTEEGKYDVDRLLTTINEKYNRVTMHGLRRELLEEQAKSIGISLQVLELPEQPSMAEYEKRMNETVARLKSGGYSDCGFGDIFLEDLRKYRKEQLRPHNITCHFPLWGMDTRKLITDFIELGFKAIVICVNSKFLDKSFVGREIDENFLNDLPPEVDPCGENGEFHTFCYDGPIFKEKIEFTLGEKVLKTYKSPEKDSKENEKTIGFWFCDLIPHINKEEH